MFTAMSMTPEHRRTLLVGAAAAAAIAVLALSAIRLAGCSCPSSSSNSGTDKPLSKRQLQRMSPEERRALTTALRQRADAAAHAGGDDNLERAAELYTRALAAADTDTDTPADPSVVAGLYTSRAWCYAHMQPARHREVVRDCDAALALDPRDAMAVLRRSISLQALKAMGGL